MSNATLISTYSSRCHVNFFLCGNRRITVAWSSVKRATDVHMLLGIKQIEHWKQRVILIILIICLAHYYRCSLTSVQTLSYTDDFIVLSSWSFGFLYSVFQIKNLANRNITIYLLKQVFERGMTINNVPNLNFNLCIICHCHDLVWYSNIMV